MRLLLLLGTVGLWAQSPEMRVVNAAAEAMGGRDKIRSIRSLAIYGYGQQAYQNGGGNITTSPDAPQKWIDINASVRTIDFENHRMNLRQQNVQDFVFAAIRNMTGEARVNQSLDGAIAFNGNARANEDAVRSRRVEMLDNPLSLTRAALDAASKLSGLRREGALDVLDLRTADDIRVTAAFDSASHLPAWMRWVGPDPNLGDVTYRTHFIGYQNENGVQLPAGYNTVMDFRNVVWHKLYVDKYLLNSSVTDLEASAAVRNAPLPVAPKLTVEAVPVGKGIWYLRGAGGNSTLYEFDDHLTMFECYGSDTNTRANIEKARTLVPAKPLTECIVSHHHFDHTGGLRTAVSEGLTIITHRANVDFLKEVVGRSAKQFPDALERNRKPLKIIPVDEQLILKDKSMEVRIQRVISNSHMANGIFAYAPSVRAVSEGDLVDESWDIVWWGNSYPASVKFWKLDVATDLAVHGNLHTYPEVLDLLRKQTRAAQALCAHVEQSKLSMRGCPVNNFPE